MIISHKIFSLIIVLLVFIFSINNVSGNENSQNTKLVLHDFGLGSSWNAGEPIVFRGKLTANSSERIGNADILIKSDGPCPEDGTIAKGITNKHGKFSIFIIAKIWDESDNLIKVHAEFLGNDEFEPSKSRARSIVVYPTPGEKCEI